MTALRPERESDSSYGQQAYGESGGYGGPGTRGGAGAYGGGHGGTYEGSGGYGESGTFEERPSGTDARGGEGHHREGDDGRAVPGDDRDTGGSGGYVPGDDATVALRIPGYVGSRSYASEASAASGGTSPAPGGRAARRKAAKRRRGRRGGAAAQAGSRRTGGLPAGAARDAGAEQQAPRAPLSRVEARRLARARKPGPAVVASRAIGEVFITIGVLMLLFVTYQLWWTNVRAHAQAGKEASNLQQDWADGKRNPGTFQPGQGFAILHIPKLDVVVPIAEGTSKHRVLDKGMVGHYGEGSIKTAMPDAKTGNFGLAGHRNTHGEPFRYINRLKPGDPVVVETQDTYYVYKVTSTLPMTPPSNTAVLNPIPKGSGFTAPGRYITLTTCTPEFTSKYRLIVWGKMVEERPRSKGKPDALVS
ncbi:class E sortase [Streptomyces sp. MS06]|uniref:class E sortase n=1 Tax=Streptomyces sp. MS06 TaxID=3385974 RepID=UPI00399FF92A